MGWALGGRDRVNRVERGEGGATIGLALFGAVEKRIRVKVQGHREGGARYRAGLCKWRCH